MKTLPFHRASPSLTIWAAVLFLTTSAPAASPTDTILGTNAGFSITTGVDDTAIGNSALRLNLTGYSNTAVGSLALSSNKDGFNNTALGFGALQLNTASYNTAVGRVALFSNNLGTNNVAVGSAALYANDSGSYNTSTGTQTLRYNFGGANNTATGALALYSNTSGGGNVANGFQSLYSNLTGNGNAALGDGALFNATGSFNIGIGYEAGYNLNAGSSNNIEIGSKGVAGDSGIIRIGTAGTHTNTYLTGVIHGDGSGLTGVPATISGNINTTGSITITSTGNANAIFGNNPTGTGVAGNSGTGVGVSATSDASMAMQGISRSNALILAGGHFVGNVFIPRVVTASGVWGDNSGGGAGVSGTSTSGNGIYGESSTGMAGYFKGDLVVTGMLHQNFLTVRGGANEQAYLGGDGLGNDIQIGSTNASVTEVYCFNATTQKNMNLHVKSLTITGGADFAEPFHMSHGELAPGSVVVIDAEHPGELNVSRKAYDTHVAGIVSGAKGINPGIALHQEGVLEGGQNVALSGRVYVMADASVYPIKPGDLLTTCETPGHAMKAIDHDRTQGAVIGKAMSSLNEGTGMVLVLVTLQ